MRPPEASRARRGAPVTVLVARLLVIVVGLVIVSFGWVLWSSMRSGPPLPGTSQVSSARSPSDIEVDVPVGYAADLAAGRAEPLLPAELRARVGQRITIRNRDASAVRLGMFFVRAGETVTQRFTTPGSYRGECSLHPGGQFTLRVTA